jgi:signal transduction histidine kinase/CheY-like chemotaxis protein
MVAGRWQSRVGRKSRVGNASVRVGWSAYVLATVLGAAATGLRLLLLPALGPDSTLLILPLVVAISAYFGGLGPGLLATLLAAAGGALSVLAPSPTILATLDKAHVDVLLASGVVISVLAEALHRARQRAELAARTVLQGEERFRAAQELSLDGFSILAPIRDATGQVIDFRIGYANPAAGRSLGKPLEELVGHRLLTVLPSIRSNSELFDRFVRVINTGEPHDLEVLYEGDGVSGWFRNMALKLGDSVAVYFSDITARKRAEQQLEQAKQQAEAGTEARDRFFAVLSHELRTPLTPVLLTASVLESNTSLGLALLQDMALIRRNIELEVRLIDDLLDFNRIARGKLEIIRQTLDAHEMLDAAVDICRADAEEKHLEIIRSYSAGSHFVWGDPARFHQIAWNLLRNSIKFTASGGRIAIRTSNPVDRVLRLEIADTGIGIEAETLSHLFEPFEQGGFKVTRQFGGLGLGCAISKALVEAHGGTIRAESDGRDKGAVFVIELPTTTAAKEEPPPSGPPDTKPLGRKLKVLVVEDHPATADVLTRVLSRSGHDVLSAESVASALRTARSTRPDVLVSDLGLPDGTGNEIMHELRKTRPDLPGIALSGYGMESDVKLSKEAGFMEHIVKPVEIDTLIKAIERVARAADKNAH